MALGKLTLDALAEQLQLAYPRRHVARGDGFVLVVPCSLCGHTRCGEGCPCDCGKPRESLS